MIFYLLGLPFMMLSGLVLLLTFGMHSLLDSGLMFERTRRFANSRARIVAFVLGFLPLPLLALGNPFRNYPPRFPVFAPDAVVYTLAVLFCLLGPALAGCGLAIPRQPQNRIPTGKALAIALAIFWINGVAAVMCWGFRFGGPG